MLIFHKCLDYLIYYLVKSVHFIHEKKCLPNQMAMIRWSIARPFQLPSSDRIDFRIQYLTYKLFGRVVSIKFISILRIGSTYLYIFLKRFQLMIYDIDQKHNGIP